MTLFIALRRHCSHRAFARLSRSSFAIQHRVMVMRMSTDVNKKGFWAGNFTPKEDADMEDFAVNYRAPMIASLAAYGGKLVMVAPKPAAVYHHGEGAVSFVAEFPSVEHATEWHESKAYQSLIPCRDKYITANYVIAEGTGA